MSYFDNNEEAEFHREGGRLYLYVIHRNHSHNGMCPHAHILDLTSLRIEQTECERDLNYYMGQAHKYGKVIPYR